MVATPMTKPVPTNSPVTPDNPRPLIIFFLTISNVVSAISNPSQIMAPLDQRSLAMPKSGPQSPVSKPVFIASYVSPPNSTTASITISPVTSTAGSTTSTVHFHASLSVIRTLSASKRPISSLTASELLNQSQALPAVSTTHSQPSSIRLLT